MFPYNRAINRSIRQSSKQTANMECGKRNEATVARNKEEDIKWDFEEYKLSYVLDNFKLPQIVRVVEGFMFTEEDSLASGTVLTIHGQQRIEQVCAVENCGSNNDVFIPLSCPYRVKVVAPDRVKVYKTVKDLCNATPLPKCVVVNEKITSGGIKIPSGRWLIVKSISKNKNDQADGICVELLDDRLRALVLPLKVVGNFAPCPLPCDQGRSYFIRELCDRSFPLGIKFLPSGEKNPSYGPHMGVLKLMKQQTIDIVFSTTEIEGQKFAISFSRGLPVTVEVARGSLDCTETYSRRCKAAEEEVDIDVLNHLKDTNPYSCMYQSAIYADVCAIRKAFQERNEISMSQCSSESYHSDVTSFSDDRQGEIRCKIDSVSQSLGSTSSQIYDNHVSRSSSESSNLSDGMVHRKKSTSYQKPAYVYLDPLANRARNPSSVENYEPGEDSEDDDYEDVNDEHDYVEIIDTMDSNISKPVKQKKSSHSYTYIDVLPPRPDVAQGKLFQIKGPPPQPFAKSQSVTSSEQSTHEAMPYASRRSLARALSEGATLIDRDAIDQSFEQPILHQIGKSNESDVESTCSEYHSFSSIPNAVKNEAADAELQQNEAQKIVPKKPVRRAGPPKPLPRKSSLGNNYSIVRDVDVFKSDLRQLDDTSGVRKKTSTSTEEIREPFLATVVGNTPSLKEDYIKLNDEIERRGESLEQESVDDNSMEGKNLVDRQLIPNSSHLNGLDENGVGDILDEIQLSEFKEIFKSEQINGSLLVGLDIETLQSLGLNTFQAIKVVDYVERVNQSDINESDVSNCGQWTTAEVRDRMNEINLSSLAEFCINNHVDGRLLESIIDKNGFDSLRTDYSVSLNTLHQTKVVRYVKQNWRQTSL